MNPLAAARALAAFWPKQATLTENELPPCIETTRLVTAAFERAGIEGVTALPCALHLFNPLATAAMLTGTKPTHNATKITVSPEALGSKVKRGWRGHLVVEHETFLLDLVLGGLVRSVGSPPGFETVGPFVGEKHTELHFLDGAWVGVSADGVAIKVEPRRRLRSYLSTEAWTGDLDDELVEIVADCLRD